MNETMTFSALECFISVVLVAENTFLEAAFVGIFRNFSDFLLCRFRHFAATFQELQKHVRFI